MEKIKVGDRVEVISRPGGLKGTVIKDEDDSWIGVRHDSRIDWGHNCTGLCEDNFGWFYIHRELKLIKNADLNLKSEIIDGLEYC